MHNASVDAPATATGGGLNSTLILLLAGGLALGRLDQPPWRAGR